MNMRRVLYILFVGALFLSTGCVTLYKPNVVHSPLLKEKGDWNTTAAIGLSGCGLLNIQSSYAVSSHAGIMADGMYHFRHFTSAGASTEKLNMFFGEAGGGYFSSFGKDNNRLFQVYSGMGYGAAYDRIDSPGESVPEASARYFNVFIQPGLGFTYKSLDLGLDLRANYVRLFEIHAYLYEQFEWWNTDFQFYSDTTLHFVLLEPALALRGGGEKWTGVFQFGLTVPAIHAHSYFMVNTSSMLAFPLFKVSLGVSYSFGNERERHLNSALTDFR